MQKEQIEKPKDSIFNSTSSSRGSKSCVTTGIDQFHSTPLMQMKRAEHEQIFGSNSSETPVQRKANSTGLPDNLKSGVENLSGISMDNVKVHYNSDKPAQLQAHAYTQGTDIHVATGQEKHLPHEVWHVVQQAQGRVAPTMQMKGINVNDNAELEREATEMGNEAIQMKKPKESKKEVFNKSIIQKKNDKEQNKNNKNRSILYKSHEIQPVTQLLVAAIPDPSGMDDKVFMNTTLTAHAAVGGKIKKFVDCNFANTNDFNNDNEKLAITGHGSKGEISGMKSQQIADVLTDPIKGLNKPTHDINFESCCAAIPENVGLITSVIGTVYDTLKTKKLDSKQWATLPMISGSNGPQIATNKRKDTDLNGPNIDKAVVDSKYIDKTTNYLAAEIQNTLISQMTNVKQKQPILLNDDGVQFINDARIDEDDVSKFKQVFIEIIRGTPKNIDKIDPTLRAKLKTEWGKGHLYSSVVEIFDNGLDMRAKPETVTTLTLMSSDVLYEVVLYEVKRIAFSNWNPYTKGVWRAPDGVKAIRKLFNENRATLQGLKDITQNCIAHPSKHRHRLTEKFYNIVSTIESNDKVKLIESCNNLKAINI